MDIQKIRKEFPILEKGIIYFDNAATSLKPKFVVEEIKRFYEEFMGNVHRGVHFLSQKASEEYEEAHEKVREFLNADRFEEIIFVKNTTEALNLIAYSYGLNFLERGEEILISVMEHNSNLLPWLFLEKVKGIKVNFVGLKNFHLDLEDLKNKLSKKTKIVSLTLASNVLGSLQDIYEISKMVKEVNEDCIFVVDGAQGIPHKKIDLKKGEIDFLCFSAHKMLGPFGLGILYGRKELLEKMPCFLYGGGTIKNLENREVKVSNLPWKFEAGTPNVEGGIAFKKVLEFLEGIGFEEIEEHENKLCRYFLKKIEEIENLKLIGPKEKRVATFSFTFNNLLPHAIAEILNEEKICVRSGKLCANYLLNYLGLNEGVIRASLYLYNTKEEIDRFVEVLKGIKI